MNRICNQLLHHQSINLLRPVSTRLLMLRFEALSNVSVILNTSRWHSVAELYPLIPSMNPKRANRRQEQSLTSYFKIIAVDRERIHKNQCSYQQMKLYYSSWEKKTSFEYGMELSLSRTKLKQNLKRRALQAKLILNPLEIHSYKTLTGWGTMSLCVLHLQKAFCIQPNRTIYIDIRNDKLKPKF